MKRCSMICTMEIQICSHLFGHKAYLDGYILGEDYVIFGTTSDKGIFFWMTTAVAVTSIDDLADPTKTDGFDMQVYMSSASNTGLYINTVNIINDLNEKRLAINSSASLFYYDATWNSALEADLFNMLDTADSGNDKFIVVWHLPQWGYQAYIVNGQYMELANGDVGTTYFGRINRGTAISTPQFAKSGVIDTTTWDVLSSVFVGGDAISDMENGLLLA